MGRDVRGGADAVTQGRGALVTGQRVCSHVQEGERHAGAPEGVCDRAAVLDCERGDRHVVVFGDQDAAAR